MRKFLSVRSLAVLALAGSGLAAVALPAGVAGAKAPVKVTCTGLFGLSSSSELSGCSGHGAKISPYAVEVPNSGDTAATIYWTDKTTTTSSISYVTGSFTCPNLGGDASVTGSPITETGTVTGGNSKITTGVANVTDACVYTIGSDIIIDNDGSFSLG